MDTITKEEFESLVRQAIEALPDKFKEKLDNVDLTIEAWPTIDQIRELRIPASQTLFGLYQGVPKTKRGTYFGVLPDKITIFAGPILAVSPTPEAVKKRVTQVVRHEIAHHFGLREEEVRKAEKGSRGVLPGKSFVVEERINTSF